MIYTRRFCPFCLRARALLNSKGVRYTDIAVDGNPALRREMMEKAGRRTVPRIWIGGRHIGGCEELYRSERRGELDAMIMMAKGARDERS